MMRTGIADLKARLSHYLGVARAGEEVLITDRGLPVAKLTPLAAIDTATPPHLLDMVRRGEVRMGRVGLPQSAPARPRARPGVSVVQALLDERSEGR